MPVPDHVPSLEILLEQNWALYGWLVESVAQRHGMPPALLLGRRRTHRVTCARRELASGLWCSGLSYAEVGRLLGLHHTSVMDLVRKELAA